MLFWFSLHIYLTEHKLLKIILSQLVNMHTNIRYRNNRKKKLVSALFIKKINFFFDLAQSFIYFVALFDSLKDGFLSLECILWLNRNRSNKTNHLRRRNNKKNWHFYRGRVYVLTWPEKTF
jgi:hypothetical protein